MLQISQSSPYSVILFDWDGTLVDSMPLVLAGHNLVREKLGYPLWGMAEVLKYATKSARENFPVLYGDRAGEAESLFYTYVNAHRFDILKSYPQTHDALTHLKSAGFRLGVVSNKKYEYLNIEIDHFGWRSFFESIVGAGEAEQDKPSALPIKLALSRMGYNQDIKTVLYVGDTITDKDTAHHAGTDWAYVHQGDEKSALIEHNPPVWRGVSALDLAHWLLQNRA
ncbi:MAG: HAD family hydrolase [Alphaproteobacteria bacterium]|nr:HAD family hydrolase [Alphaproteobacteria bacterium]